MSIVTDISATTFSSARRAGLPEPEARKPKPSLVQSNFLDVIGHTRVHQPPQRFPRAGGIPNRSRRNWLVHLLQQMNRRPGQNQVPRGRLLVKRTRHRRLRPQTLWQRIGHVSQRISRTAGYHESTLPKKILRLVPLGDIGESIDPDQEKQPVASLQRPLESPHRVDGVIRFK